MEPELALESCQATVHKLRREIQQARAEHDKCTAELGQIRAGTHNYKKPANLAGSMQYRSIVSHPVGQHLSPTAACVRESADQDSAKHHIKILDAQPQTGDLYVTRTTQIGTRGKI